MPPELAGTNRSACQPTPIDIRDNNCGMLYSCTPYLFLRQRASSGLACPSAVGGLDTAPPAPLGNRLLGCLVPLEGAAAPQTRLPAHTKFNRVRRNISTYV